MARPLRIEFPGAFYHVTARGNERRAIYRDDRDRRRFLEILAEAAARYRLLVHAYVLMRNHYHLLLETPEANLSRALRHLNGVYTQDFNRRHRRVGHLFQGRYKALLVEKDSYLLELSRYIHLNPVRVGEVKEASQFRWSSAGGYVGRRKPLDFVRTDDVLSYFGNDRTKAQGRYRSFLAEGAAAPVQEAPWEKLVGQTLLGSQRWVQKLREQLRGRRRQLEVPATRELPPRPTVKEIIGAARRHWKVKEREIRQPRSLRGQDVRPLVMYLAYERAGKKLDELAQEFGVTPFAVSAAVRRVRLRLRQDRRLAATLRKLSTYIQT